MVIGDCNYAMIHSVCGISPNGGYKIYHLRLFKYSSRMCEYASLYIMGATCDFPVWQSNQWLWWLKRVREWLYGNPWFL